MCFTSLFVFGLLILKSGVAMARWMSVNRYRMVNLQSGKVVVVFQLYPEMKPVEGCRQACHELGIELDVGFYRLDSMKQDKDTGEFKWVKLYRFSLEVS